MTTNIRTRRLTRSPPVTVFAVCHELVGGEAPASQQSSTPVIGLSAGCTSMHFGENQLSPCSFGISPLPTTHPNLLQQIPVRPFTSHYGRCSLVMGSSHGFRSTGCHRCAVHTRVRWASGCDCLRQATPSNSSGHTPKGTRSPGEARLRQRLSLHGRGRFQGLFHSPRRGAFHRSLTVLCAIGHDE